MASSLLSMLAVILVQFSFLLENGFTQLIECVQINCLRVFTLVHVPAPKELQDHEEIICLL